jgi:hypothetical protein
MSTLDVLALERRALVERSALSRAQLRANVRALRETMRWPRVAVAVGPTAARAALGVALAVAGLSRTARFMALAGRVVLFVRIVRFVAGYAKSRS